MSFSNFLIIGIPIWFALSAAVGALARHYRRDTGKWFLASFLLSPVLVGGILLLKGPENTNTEQEGDILYSKEVLRLENTNESWGWPARLLHWAMAVLILFQLGVGVYMVEVIGDDLINRFQLTQTHKSFGFVVFALAVIRLIWRAANPRPAPPAMPTMQRAAAEGAHIALYVLMFALPITGWLMASASPLNDPGAYPFQVKNMVFGLFELPDPYPEGSKALSEQLARFHWGFALALAAILAVHAGAALKHEFVDRDGLLRRMIWGR